MAIELYPFRYRDLVTGKWVRARYKAELHQITARYAEWKIDGPPEIRTPIEGYFAPSTDRNRLPDDQHCSGFADAGTTRRCCV